jgi:hypothetical protein
MAFQKERRELQANLVVPFVFEIDLMKENHLLDFG